MPVAQKTSQARRDCDLVRVCPIAGDIVVEDGVHIMGPLLRDRISEIFKQIDLDHDATVDQRELIEGFGLVGIQLTPEEADRIMKVCREQKRAMNSVTSSESQMKPARPAPPRCSGR